MRPFSLETLITEGKDPSHATGWCYRGEQNSLSQTTYQIIGVTTCAYLNCISIQADVESRINELQRALRAEMLVAEPSGLPQFNVWLLRGNIALYEEVLYWIKTKQQSNDTTAEINAERRERGGSSRQFMNTNQEGKEQCRHSSGLLGT